MRSSWKSILVVLMLTSPVGVAGQALSGSLSVAGSVRDAAGKPVVGAMVRLRNTQTGVTTSVASQTNGNYRVTGLSANKYDAVAVRQGYRNARVGDIDLTSSKQDVNFGMVLGATNLTDPGLTEAQLMQVLPDSPMKKQAVDTCSECHSVSGMVAKQRQDESGWQSTVTKMRNLPGYRLGIDDQTAAGIANVWATVFGSDSDFKVEMTPDQFLPKVDVHALDITYVEYPIQTTTTKAVSFHIYLDSKREDVWWGEWGGDRVGVLHENTGKMEEFGLTRGSRPHSLAEDKDGNIYFTEIAGNKIGRIDVATKKLTENLLAPAPETGRGNGGMFAADGTRSSTPHPIVVDRTGQVWVGLAGINTFLDFDPSTGKKTMVPLSIPQGARSSIYDMVEPDSKGRIWFTDLAADIVGYIDPETHKITQIDMPKKSGPRMMQLDSRGNVWVSFYYSGQIGRIDPNTHEVKIYDLPERDTHPYALGIDSQDHPWVYGMTHSRLYRLDPNTKAIATYMLPQNGVQIRAILPDSNGWMWTVEGSPDRLLKFKLNDERSKTGD